MKMNERSAMAGYLSSYVYMCGVVSPLRNNYKRLLSTVYVYKNMYALAFIRLSSVKKLS